MSAASILFGLREDVSISTAEGGEMVLEGAGARVVIIKPSPGMRAAIVLLSVTRQDAAGGATQSDETAAGGRCAAVGEPAGPAGFGKTERSPFLGSDEETLTAGVVAADGAAEVAPFHEILGCLLRRGLVLRSVWNSGAHLATLIPISPAFATGRFTPTDSSLTNTTLTLSRFAYLRSEDGNTFLASPLAHAKILIMDRRVSALLHDLARPNHADALVARSTDLPEKAVHLLLALLGEVGMLRGIEDQPALWTWEFHDLLFHACTRNEDHDHFADATYRFADRLPLAPAVQPRSGYKQVIALDTPDHAELERLDPPFARVHESRRSIRDFGAQGFDFFRLYTRHALSLEI